MTNLSHQTQNKKLLQVKATAVQYTENPPSVIADAHDSWCSNSQLPGTHVSWECHQVYLRSQREIDDGTARKSSPFVLFESRVKAAPTPQCFVQKDFLPEHTRTRTRMCLLLR